MFMVPRRPAGELLLLGFVSEARDLCLERACREMGLAPEYLDCVKPLLRLPESAYPRCCGGGCEPCAEKYRCNASCACANIAETGQSDHAGGVQCWYEQAVIELADAAGWRLLGAGHEGFAEAVYGGVTEAASGRAVSDKLTARVALSRRLPVLP